jgi:hypothetical protein
LDENATNSEREIPHLVREWSEHRAMARPRSSAPQSQPTILKPLDALPRLGEALAKADGLATPSARIDDCSLWMTETELLVAAAFGRGSSEHVDFQHAGRPMGVVVAGAYSDAQILDDVRREVKAKALALRAFTSHLALVADLTSTADADTTANSSATRKPISTKVFVVHGHDTATRDAVARFLYQLGLEAIILQEQPNKGRTIVEKFEEHASEVGYAVVLLTGDDVGEVKGTELAKLRPRARQNVVFELGYFFAKLGRGRVCALYEDGVELPSDVSGVLYVALGGSAWHLPVARELRDAFPGRVDMTKL